MQQQATRRAAKLAVCLGAICLAVLAAAPKSSGPPAAAAAAPAAVALGPPSLSAGGRPAAQPAWAGVQPAPLPEATVASLFQWPLDGEPQVARRFEPPAQRWLPGHRGVDLAGEPGQVVRTSGAGTVFFAGPVGGVGVVSIAHTGGLRTTYQPVAPTVTAGDPVAAGDPIGVLEPGHSGCAGTACLHWGLRRDDFYLDPLTLLGLGRVRLLPVE